MSNIKQNQATCESLGCDNTATETLISSVCPSITFNLCSEHAKEYLKTGSSAESEMPQIECNIKDPNLAGYVKLKLDGAKEQRDADMARLPAHDQQVRREFAEKVLTYLLGEGFDVIAKSIRAMAEGGR